MKQLLTICFVVFALQSVAQQQILKRFDGSVVKPSQIDSIIKVLMTENNIKGIGIAVLNNKKISYIKSYGYRNFYKNEPLNESTIMYGASLSKAVFGYLVTRLVQEKIIELDKPLYQYLKKPIKEYEYFSDLASDERWKLITGRMCLNHTTGLPNVRWFNPTSSEPDTLGIMKIYFTPGSKYAYSGEALKLLQLAIEETTGKKLDELAEARIFKPFGMTRTGYVWHESFGDDNVAVGHLNSGEIDQKRKRTEAVAGGSMVTTITDYAKFTEAMMNRRGLNKQLFNEMISPQIRIHSVTQFPPISFETTTENDSIDLSYALGWGVFKCQQGRAFFKE